MKIKKISMHNFRQYVNANISFENSKNSISLIFGEGGTGKTTICQAIIWAFSYANVSSINNEDIINRKVVDVAVINEIVQCEVTLEIQHNGEEYVFYKKMSCCKGLMGNLRDFQIEHEIKSPTDNVDNLEFLRSEIWKWMVFEEDVMRYRGDKYIKYCINRVLSDCILGDVIDYTRCALKEFYRQLPSREIDELLSNMSEMYGKVQKMVSFKDELEEELNHYRQIEVELLETLKPVSNEEIVLTEDAKNLYMLLCDIRNRKNNVEIKIKSIGVAINKYNSYINKIDHEIKFLQSPSSQKVIKACDVLKGINDKLVKLGQEKKMNMETEITRRAIEIFNEMTASVYSEELLFKENTAEGKRIIENLAIWIASREVYMSKFYDALGDKINIELPIVIDFPVQRYVMDNELIIITECLIKYGIQIIWCDDLTQTISKIFSEKISDKHYISLSQDCMQATITRIY